jgi:hypothetical protein
MRGVRNGPGLIEKRRVEHVLLSRSYWLSEVNVLFAYRKDRLVEHREPTRRASAAISFGYSRRPAYS